MGEIQIASGPLRFGVVILAAGSSTRMGKPKLLLPWRETSILGYLLETWNGLGAQQIGVACAAGAADINEELDRLGFPKGNRISNPKPERGMFSSIQCAASWSGWEKNLTHWVITLGDQPHVKRETLEGLLAFGTANPGEVCQPIQNGRRRHPVLLPQAVWNALPNSSASDLKTFLHAYAGGLAGWEANDPGLDLDLDTAEDYKRATRFNNNLP